MVLGIRSVFMSGMGVRVGVKIPGWKGVHGNFGGDGNVLS